MKKTRFAFLLFMLLGPLTSCQTLEQAFETHVDPALYKAKSFFAGGIASEENKNKQPVIFPDGAYYPNTMLGISRAMTDGRVDVYDLGYAVPSTSFVGNPPIDRVYDESQLFEDRTMDHDPSVTVYSLDSGIPLSSGRGQNKAINLIPQSRESSSFNSPFDNRGRLKEAPREDLSSGRLMTTP